MRERRFTPLSKGRAQKVRGPSGLADLDGSRRPGQVLKAFSPTKAPKIRFRPGDWFEFDGELWEIIYIFRLKERPGEWLHELESREMESPDRTLISLAVLALGAGKDTPRIVYNEFQSSMDASDYFWDIPGLGSSRICRSTEELLKFKKIEKPATPPNLDALEDQRSEPLPAAENTVVPLEVACLPDDQVHCPACSRVVMMHEEHALAQFGECACGTLIESNRTGADIPWAEASYTCVFPDGRSTTL